MVDKEGEAPSFQTVEEEMDYWKCQAKRFRELYVYLQIFAVEGFVLYLHS